MTDLSSATSGDPDVGVARLSRDSLCGKSVSVRYTAPGGTVTPGLWITAPTECGPYGSAARAGTAATTVSVTTAGFDRNVQVPTGDLEQLATSAQAGNKAIADAVQLQPGKSARVNVVFDSVGGPIGTAVSGTLYLDAVQGGTPPYGQFAADEVAALPYSYVVARAGLARTSLRRGHERG